MPPFPSTAPARPAPRPGKPLFRRVFRVLAFRALAIILALSLATIAPPPAQAAPRIKDLVEIEGVRGNDLVGYGLVVGLAGTGDGIRNSPFTEEALANLLERLGVNVSGESPSGPRTSPPSSSPPPCPRSSSLAGASTSPSRPSATPRACSAAPW